MEQLVINSSPDSPAMWTIRQRLYNESEVTILSLARVGLVLLTLFIAFYKMLHLQPVWFVAGVAGWILCMYVLVISRMVTTGKVRAKGAKSRRKRWFPFLYNK